jgi:hypothetical protein
LVEQPHDPAEGAVLPRALHAALQGSHAVRGARGHALAGADVGGRGLARQVRRDDLPHTAQDHDVGRDVLAGAHDDLVSLDQPGGIDVADLAACFDAMSGLRQALGEGLRGVAALRPRVGFEAAPEHHQHEDHRRRLVVDGTGARDGVVEGKAVRRERAERDEAVHPHEPLLQVAPGALHDRNPEEREDGEREKRDGDLPEPPEQRRAGIAVRRVRALAVEHARELHHSHGEEGGQEESRLEESPLAVGAGGYRRGEPAPEAAEEGRAVAASPAPGDDGEAAVRTGFLPGRLRRLPLRVTSQAPSPRSSEGT